jgi:hypothetical protein
MARDCAERDVDDACQQDRAGAAMPDAGDTWERARLAARRYFCGVPPYRIKGEKDGRFSVSRKHYSFWGDEDPAAATRWVVLSWHEDWDAAERRLRHITSPAAYFDAQGRLAQGPPPEPEDWGLPPDDKDE